MDNLSKKELFSWQKECLELWTKNDERGIVNVVTGAGKTFLALEAIRLLKGKYGHKLKIKIVVPKIFLCTQWLNSIKDELDVPRRSIGIYNGTFKDNVSKDYMLYVVNSARYKLARHILSDMEKGISVLLICDECHHYGSEENSKIFDFVPLIDRYKAKYFSLGLSATPETENYQNVLIPALGKEIFKYGFVDAMKADIAAKYSIFNVRLNFDADEKYEYDELTEKISSSMFRLKKVFPAISKLHGKKLYRKLKSMRDGTYSELAKRILILLYRRKAIVYLARSRIDCVLALIARLDYKSKVIVFGERIESVDLLYDRLKNLYPGQIGRYHSEMNVTAKKSALDQYQNSEIRILLSCRALDEGLNVPDTDIGIILSSTGSLRQRIQRIGRILRKSKNGNTKKVYYLHVSNSAEDEFLVPHEIHGDVKVHELYYDHHNNKFLNPEYDTFINKLLKECPKEKITPEILEELCKNLELGLIRGDWCTAREKCLENIKTSVGIAERNYWIAMYKVKMGDGSNE